jgi:hypothetical protein
VRTTEMHIELNMTNLFGKMTSLSYERLHAGKDGWQRASNFPKRGIGTWGVGPVVVVSVGMCGCVVVSAGMCERGHV